MLLKFPVVEMMFHSIYLLVWFMALTGNQLYILPGKHYSGPYCFLCRLS
jgi:hypothetical protein